MKSLLICTNWIFEGENRPENWDTKYLFNCFTFHISIFHNETNWENFLTIRDEKCDFLRLVKKIYGDKRPQNYFPLPKKLPNDSKSKPKNLEKPYISRDN